MNVAHVDALLNQAFGFVHDREDFRNPGHNKSDIEPPSDAQNQALLDKEEFRKHMCAEIFSELQLDDSQKMGYVYKCLGSAVLALRQAIQRTGLETLSPKGRANQFEDIMTDLIMQGGDADTNGCTAGAILGAWFGFSRLPYTWLDGIQNYDWLLLKAEALSQQAEIFGSRSDVVKVPDTAPDGGRGLFTDKELNDRERGLLEMMLNKAKDRREAEARDREAKKKGFGGFVKGLTGSK